MVGSVLGVKLLEEVVDKLRGYRWNYLDRCIIEHGIDGNGLNFCREPVDCNICSDVNEIEVLDVDEIDVDLFEKR